MPGANAAARIFIMKDVVLRARELCYQYSNVYNYQDRIRHCNLTEINPGFKPEILLLTPSKVITNIINNNKTYTHILQSVRHMKTYIHISDVPTFSSVLQPRGLRSGNSLTERQLSLECQPLYPCSPANNDPTLRIYRIYKGFDYTLKLPTRTYPIHKDLT